MFGSSQDRARQLAGRSRRERISSIGSHSSSLSIGSPHTSSQPGNATTPPGPTFERNDAKDGFILPSVSQLPVWPHPLKVEQHRLQSEHLSQVLYNSLDLCEPASLPQRQFGSSRHVRYGSLGTPSSLQCKISRPLPRLCICQAHFSTSEEPAKRIPGYYIAQNTGI